MRRLLVQIGQGESLVQFLCPALPTRPHQTVVVVKSGQDGLSQTPSIGRMVDREAKRAEGKGIGYDRWASMHNLKAWSKTFLYLQEHDLLSPDKLGAAVDAAGAEAREARSRYDAAAAKVTGKKGTTGSDGQLPQNLSRYQGVSSDPQREGQAEVLCLA